MLVDLSSELELAFSLANEVLIDDETERRSKYMPHLSLLYSHMEESKRKDIVEQVNITHTVSSLLF